MKLWDQAAICVRLLVSLLMNGYVMLLGQHIKFDVEHYYLHLASTACHVGHKSPLQDLKQNAQSITLAWMAREATVCRGTH